MIDGLQKAINQYRRTVQQLRACQRGPAAAARGARHGADVAFWSLSLTRSERLEGAVMPVTTDLRLIDAGSGCRMASCARSSAARAATTR